jgi:hypothetical protein
MNTEEYIKSLFAGYEETPEMLDFMEELRTNMDDRIALLVKKGAAEDEAFAAACAELGDISVLADEISREKRKEAFAEAYMGTRRYIKKGRAASYIIAGALMLFGLLTAAIVYTATMSYAGYANNPDFSGVFGSLLIFVTASVALFVWLGCTQETATRYPMSPKRGGLYAVAGGLITFGLLLFPLVYVSAGPYASLTGGLGSLLPFVVSGAALLAFLLLTEKPRGKPWVMEQAHKVTTDIFRSASMA